MGQERPRADVCGKREHAPRGAEPQGQVANRQRRGGKRHATRPRAHQRERRRRRGGPRGRTQGPSWEFGTGLTEIAKAGRRGRRNWRRIARGSVGRSFLCNSPKHADLRKMQRITNYLIYLGPADKRHNCGIDEAQLCICHAAEPY